MTRVAMISGASRGIGAALGRRLVQDGWAVSLGMRQPALPDWATDAVHVQAHDASDPASDAAWVGAVADRFGRIDAVAANAGMMTPKSVIEASDDDIRAMMDVHVMSPRRLAPEIIATRVISRPPAAGGRRASGCRSGPSAHPAG